MVSTQRPIESVTLTTVRDELSSLVDRVSRNETRVMVEKSGVPVAALVSPEDLERLDQLDRDRDAFFAVVDDVRTAFAGVSDDELERETDRILAQAHERSSTDANAVS